MRTIVIRDPAYCAQFIHPHPNGAYGLFRLAYMGTGVPIAETGVPPNVTPELVRETLERLQEVLPLGVIGDYEILVTGRQLLAADDPVAGYAEGIRSTGWIALSGRVSSDLYDLLAHEIAHELEHCFSASQLEELWRIVGQEKGDLVPWEKSWKERFAEYFSAAIWGTPIKQSILDWNDPDPTEETLARIREWAMPVLGTAQKARITIGEQPWIVLQIGSTTAYVDGVPVELDVAPVIINGRTMVPVRFISQLLGHRIDYEPKNAKTERVYIYE